MSLLLIIWILFCHWVADFVCQDEKWALNKSHSFEDLLLHTTVYSFCMGWGLLFFLEPASLALFIIITFISHTLVDYFTSRIVAEKFKIKHLGSSIPNFGAFTIIGLDQWIHYVMLFITINYLI